MTRWLASSNAGDLQWWWALDDGSSARHDTFWIDDHDQAVACLLCGKPADTAYTEFLWRPTLSAAVRTWLVEGVIERLTAFMEPAGHGVWITVDERDTELRDRLSAVGLAHQPGDDMVQMWQHSGRMPEAVPLPDGLRYTTAAERPAGMPHHLATRTGSTSPSVSPGSRCTGPISISASALTTARWLPTASAGSMRSMALASSNRSAPRMLGNGRVLAMRS